VSTRNLAWLALRELRFRWVRSLLLLLALALSSGLVTATINIGARMTASLAQAAPLLGRPADLWISSAYDLDYDLPGDLVARAEAVPGVEAVQPVVRRPVRVQTPPGPDAGQAAGPRTDILALLGADLESYLPFHDLTLAAGTLPDAQNPGLVALAPWAFVRELGLGQAVTLSVPAGQVPLPITGLIEVDSLAAAQSGLVLYASRQTVADLFDLAPPEPGSSRAATMLEVQLRAGTWPGRVRAHLEEALGPAYAVSGAARPQPQLWQRLVLGALFFVDGLTLVGSAMLVYGVFASGVRARRRQIALLRAAGATRHQVLAELSLEALFLGLAGALLGLALGQLFARIGADLILSGSGAPGATPLTPAASLWAVGLSLLAALGGACGPALRAVRLPPVEALRPEPEFLLRKPGKHWLSPVLAPATRWLLARGALVSGIDCSAAILGREGQRAFLIVVSLALILTMFLGNVGVLSLLGEEMAASLGRVVGGDYVVLPGLTTISLRELAGQDTSDVPPLSAGLLAALEDLRGQAWLMPGTTANIGALQAFSGQPTLLLDIEGYARLGGFHFQEGNWADALAAFQRGPAVLLTTAVARRLDVALGDTVRLETLQGAVDFRVAGVGDSEFTTCILDLADGATYLGANEVTAVLVKVRPGADSGAVRQALRDAVRGHGGTLLPLSQVMDQLRQIFRQAQLSIGLLIATSGVVVALGLVNASLSSVAERRREIGLLRAVGATRRQVIRLLLAEAGALGGAGAVLGLILGWGTTLVFLAVARRTLGLNGAAASNPSAWLPLLAASLATLVFGPLLGMAGTLAAAMAAARLPVLRALASP
jgi:putative ABC transport system permease protein